MNILVAEDDKVSRIILEKFLSSAGHDVVTVDNGRKALELYGALEFHMVVSDWMMPEMDGIELCKNLKRMSLENGEECYFIMVTAKNHNSDILEALEAGADDFLSKPVTKQILLERVDVGKNMLVNTAEAANPREPTNLLVAEHDIMRLPLHFLSIVCSGNGEEDIQPFAQCVHDLGSFLVKCHIPKEEAYMNRFLDRILSAQGEWLMTVSASSFSRMSEDHERIIETLPMLETAISSFISSRKNRFERERDLVRELNMEKDDAGVDSKLDHIKEVVEDMQRSRDHAIARLREITEEYVRLMEQHMEAEEELFLPFARKYMAEEDNAEIISIFRDLEDEKLRKRLQELGSWTHIPLERRICTHNQKRWVAASSQALI